MAEREPILLKITGETDRDLIVAAQTNDIDLALTNVLGLAEEYGTNTIVINQVERTPKIVFFGPIWEKPEISEDEDGEPQDDNFDDTVVTEATDVFTVPNAATALSDTLEQAEIRDQASLPFQILDGDGNYGDIIVHFIGAVWEDDIPPEMDAQDANISIIH